MKTIKEVEKLIDEQLIIQKTEKEKDYDERRQFIISRSSKKVEFLKNVIFYLRMNPTKEFLINESKRLEKEIQSIVDNFENWRQSTPGIQNMNNPKNTYESEMDLKRKKMFLKNINFILD